MGSMSQFKASSRKFTCTSMKHALPVVLTGVGMLKQLKWSLRTCGRWKKYSGQWKDGMQNEIGTAACAAHARACGVRRNEPKQPLMFPWHICNFSFVHGTSCSLHGFHGHSRREVSWWITTTRTCGDGFGCGDIRCRSS